LNNHDPGSMILEASQAGSRDGEKFQ
jgi:hypothetical protein